MPFTIWVQIILYNFSIKISKQDYKSYVIPDYENMKYSGVANFTCENILKLFHPRHALLEP